MFIGSLTLDEFLADGFVDHASTLSLCLFKQSVELLNINYHEHFL